ncbi:hypothetical protein [Pleionea sp. CnH1-48]|uniref:hypothetical protein n=1 Tax=Pleionea sp. CnH1-48 TaxID=2954494 RepID=UPI0020975C24|nr:hypothetical protein [Pleionea sp. CnH1-48]MCO7222779.1 hypothetical protein [Pleionea sp. CnH1-48]
MLTSYMFVLMTMLMGDEAKQNANLIEVKGAERVDAQLVVKESFPAPQKYQSCDSNRWPSCKGNSFSDDHFASR